jgi:hypothetical protein
MAEPNLELVIARVQGHAQAVLRGPVTQASIAECPADGEWLGIRFQLGAYLPGVPTWSLRNHQSRFLPGVGTAGFWLLNRTWEMPTFDTAESLVEVLQAEGVIRLDEVVGETLEGREPSLGLRSVQRRFVRVTGLTRENLLQIERARFAAGLLRAGAPILDVVDQAGFFDQPHLSRVVRRLIGPTPANLLQSDDQLSFLYKTAPPALT